MWNSYLRLFDLPRLAVCALLLNLVPVVAEADAKDRWARRSLPEPVTDADYYDNGRPDDAKVELGKQLFFDKILSGNLNISCATCHHAFTATGDGLSLPIGEGGRGLGVTPDTGSGAAACRAMHLRYSIWARDNSHGCFTTGACNRMPRCRMA